jgi:DUF1680 family protein
MRKIARRDFLKAAPMTAGALASVASVPVHPRDEDVPRRDAAAAAAPASADAVSTPLADYPIRPQPYFDVTLVDGFWKSKVDTNAGVTIPLEVRKLTETPRGLTGNVLEAAILSLRTHPDPRLQAIVHARIAELRREAWSGNSGFEVAATYYTVSGRTDLIEKATAAAAQLAREFAAGDPPFSGGERDAINCVQLYRATHDRTHLDLAKHYLDIRGREDSVNRSRHNQSYRPVLEQSEAVGHAVNCVSLMVSLTDVGVLAGLPPYLDAAQRMWRDVVERKLYITGGVGTTGNEGFGEPYALPNLSAYAETCAALMFITLNHRLFMATGDSRYVDVMERAMYNNALSGVSTSGDRFFYVNRLASAGDGRDVRWARASLECCPPNLVRFLASMPGFIYAQGQGDTVYVNLYVSSRTSFPVGGKRLGMSVDSEMPWGGTSRVTIAAADPIRAAVKLRVPGWARNQPVPSRLYSYVDRSEGEVSVSVNGERVSAAPDGSGYVSLDRDWRDGDRIQIEFPFSIRRAVADERVVQNRRRAALERGPIVYCAEWPDVEGGRASDLLLERTAAVAADGTLLRARARTVAKPSAPASSLTLTPYHLWANRGAGEMAVWLSSDGYTIGDVGPAGGLIFYENPSHETDGWRYLEAAPFDQSAGAKWGCFRHAIAGARATSVGSGKQNTAEMLRACSEPGSAAAVCASLDVNGVRGWFLPSRDELALMYRNLKAAGIGDFRDGGAADNFSYWTSSQASTDMAHHIDFSDAGRQHYDDKDYPRRVRAIRQI